METPAIPRIDECDGEGRVRMHRWMLPTDPHWLTGFVEDIFRRYWDRLTFGPILDGIAYEWTCPCPPDAFGVYDGYLTIGFGGPHFHMCIGPGVVPDTPEGRKRMPGAASLFRALDPTGAPNSWGFELRNGADQPMMSIYFDNPFLEGPDKIAATPDWSRLSMWRDVMQRHAGIGPDPLDATGCGFRWADAA